jgi:hypothetical protein
MAQMVEELIQHQRLFLNSPCCRSAARPGPPITVSYAKALTFVFLRAVVPCVGVTEAEFAYFNKLFLVLDQLSSLPKP